MGNVCTTEQYSERERNDEEGEADHWNPLGGGNDEEDELQGYMAWRDTVASSTGAAPQGLLSEGEPTKSCENYRSIHADAWSPRSAGSAPLTANAVSAAALAVSVAAQRRASVANRWRPALQTVFDVSHDDAASDSDSEDAAVEHPARRSSAPSSCASPPSTPPKPSRQRAASMTTVNGGWSDQARVARAAAEAAAAAAAAAEAGAPGVDVVDDSHRGRQVCSSDDSSSSSSSGASGSSDDCDSGSDDRDSDSGAEDESASPTTVMAYTHREGRDHYFAKAGASPATPEEDEEERFVASLAMSTTG